MFVFFQSFLGKGLYKNKVSDFIYLFVLEEQGKGLKKKKSSRLELTQKSASLCLPTAEI